MDAVQCALREANEELGIEPACVEVVAQLPPFLSKHKLSVSLQTIQYKQVCSVTVSTLCITCCLCSDVNSSSMFVTKLDQLA